MQSNSFAKTLFFWQGLASQMSKLLLTFIAGSLLVLTACQNNAVTPGAESRTSASEPANAHANGNGVIATFQSKGRQQRSAATNATVFRNIEALPETREVISGLAEKVSALLVRSEVSSNLVASVGKERLASVLEALFEFDSAGELRQTQAAALRGAFALLMNEEQHASFVNRLTRTAPSPSGDGVTLARKGGWTLLSLGMAKDAHPTNPERLLSQREAFAHSTNWFELTADLQKLGTLGSSQERSFANRLDLTVSPQKDALRTEIHLSSDRPFNLELGAWNVPTNAIHDPLIGFTAMQGIRAWLQQQSVSRTIGLTHAPNQAFFWSQALSPFSVSAAAFSETPQETVIAVAEKLIPSIKPTLAVLSSGTFRVFTNESMLMWNGLPLVVPFIRPAPAPDGNFLLAGLFPVGNAQIKPAPPELIAQVTSRTNLVYYDWEITAARMDQWRQISQVAAIVRNRFSGDTNLLSERWLNQIQGRLGNCVTEASLSNPNEINISRRGAIGLSSLELVALARWLDPVPVLKSKDRNSPRATPAVPAAPVKTR